VGWNDAGFLDLGAANVARHRGAVTVVVGAVSVGVGAGSGSSTTVATGGAWAAREDGVGGGSVSAASDDAAVGTGDRDVARREEVVGEDADDLACARAFHGNGTSEAPAPRMPSTRSPATPIHSLLFGASLGMTIVAISSRRGPSSGATMTGARGGASRWRATGGWLGTYFSSAAGDSSGGDGN
jgi:hypothetical protein